MQHAQIRIVACIDVGEQQAFPQAAAMLDSQFRKRRLPTLIGIVQVNEAGVDALPLDADLLRARAENIEFEFRAKNGNILTCIYNGEFIEYAGKTRLLSTAIDITNSKKAEILLNNSLQEKEILLKEIYHSMKRKNL